MFILSDRVKQSSISTGTGDIVFNSSFASFQTFAEAIGDGNSTYYTVENYENFEIGIGTYHSATNSLSRDAVILSSNSNNKISLHDVSNVFCTYPANAAFLLNVAGYATSFDTSYRGIQFPDGSIQTTAASRIRPHKTIDSDAIISNSDDVILFDCSNNQVSATLPLASDVSGYTFTFKKKAGNFNANIVAQAGNQIDSLGFFTIHHVNASISVLSDSNNWHIL